MFVVSVAVIRAGFMLGLVLTREALNQLAKKKCLIGIMSALPVMRTKSNMDEMIEISLTSTAEWQPIKCV
jgi:hypothetical protein